MPGKEHSFQPLPTAEQAYFQSMSAYPSFLAWETNLLGEAHAQGVTLAQMSKITPFRQYLSVEQRTPPNKSYAWQGSFTRLFADSQNAGQLLSFGNFQLVRSFGEQYKARYRGVELEEYLQEALFFLVPSLLSTYDSSRSSFLTYLKGTLIKDLESRVDILLHRESTVPLGQHAEPIPAKRQTNRLKIDRLSRRLRTDEGEGETVGNRIEDEESGEPFEAISRVAALHALYELAGVRPDQAEVFTLVKINGEKQLSVARRLGMSDRTVWTRRNEALAALQQLGKEQVKAILSGNLDD
jgi:hypothetical protein